MKPSAKKLLSLDVFWDRPMFVSIVKKCIEDVDSQERVVYLYDKVACDYIYSYRHAIDMYKTIVGTTDSQAMDLLEVMSVLEKKETRRYLADMTLCRNNIILGMSGSERILFKEYLSKALNNELSIARGSIHCAVFHSSSQLVCRALAIEADWQKGLKILRDAYVPEHCTDKLAEYKKSLESPRIENFWFWKGKK